MNERSFEFWLEFFKGNQKVVRGDNRSYTVSAIPEEIKNNYKTLIASISNFFDLANISPFLDRYTEFLNNIPMLVATKEDGDTIVFEAEFPIIGNIKSQNVSPGDQYFWIIGLSALCYELAAVQYGLEAPPQSRLRSIIEKFYVEYGARKALARKETKYDESARLLNSKTIEIIQQAKSAESEFNSVREKYKRSVEHHNEVANSLKESTDYWISDAKLQVEAIKSAAIDQSNLEEASKLWGRMTRESRLAFRIGLISTGALLCFTALFIVVGHEKIADYLVITAAKLRDMEAPLKDDAASTVVLISMYATRLFFVAVPAFIVFWLARFGMRFTLQSKSLLDDARQRQAMIATYIHMLQEQQIDKSHRPLMLAAIFRPLPGSTGQDVEPPYLAEALKATTPD